MTCAVCGATAEDQRGICPICGWTQEGGIWSRGVEASAFEDLSHALESGKALLASTRGRIAGAFRRRFSLHPQVMLSPYVNVGLTDENLIIQQIHPATGRAASDKAAHIPLADIHTIRATDADRMEPGRTARLAIKLVSGHELRLRASGRLAAAAHKLAGVWDSLTAGRIPQDTGALKCAGCGSSLDRPYRFCPFCGQEQSEEENER